LLRVWLLAALFCGSAAFAHAAATSAPTGRWITSNHAAVIQIAPCGKTLCGQIVGIILAHAGDPMPNDWKGRPQCGMTILQTSPVTDNDTGDIRWVGTVLDPRSGAVYQATIALDESRRLRLHGYVGLPIFGMTQVWIPFSGRTLAGCKLPDNGADIPAR
jgi:uncharacterized protein (DUF2147 family)